MKKTIWRKYEEIDELPKSVSVEVCDIDLDPLKEFCVNEFSEFYYLGNNSEDNPVRGEQSCKSIENAIELLLKKEEWTRKDVFRILAWKFGKINHLVCEEINRGNDIATEFRFHNGWLDDKDESHFKIQLRNSSIIEGEDFNFLSDAVINLHASYLNKGKQTEEIWDDLCQLVSYKKYNGIGTVYLVTLLYFITGGDKPIYDRFAMASLVIMKMRENGIKIQKNTVIRGCNLPSKKGMRGKNLLKEINVYTQYCNMLEEFFPNKEWKKRKIDRALWVYGHYFKVPES